MNTDQVKAGITHAAGIALGWAAGRYGLSADQVGAMMSDVGYVGGIAAWLYGVYAHYGMKKVASDTTAVRTGEKPLPKNTVVTLSNNGIVTGSGVVVGAIALCLLFAPTAHAATANLLETLAKKIAAVAKPDLENAIKMATTANTPQSKVRLECFNAVNSVAFPADITIAEPHLISDAERLAEIIDALQPTSPTMIACAGAAQLTGQSALALINGLVTGAAALAVVK